MAPLVPPPPVISLEEAQAIEKLILQNERPSTSTNRELNRPRSRSFIAILLGTKGPTHSFTGQDFVRWAQEMKLATDEAHAIKVGQALLDHRVAHHVSDDYEFLNESDKEYALISQETLEAKTLHNALGQLIAKPDTFHQGMLELKSKTWFGYERWNHSYAVLDDVTSKPRRLHLFKRFSAASAPFLSLVVEDCVCHLSECQECKSDWYCFNLRARKQTLGKETDFVLCANHSKRQEGWLQALMEAGVAFQEEDTGVEDMKSVFELSARLLNSDQVLPLSQFQGKVCLVVNVASKWGLTKRDYQEMVQIYNAYHARGFEILAFPCNQFGSQEKEDEATIQEFVKQFDVQFPVFGKIDVNGADAHPVFRFLRGKLGGVMGSSVKWNFTKFLCDRNGIPVKRFGPPTAPSALAEDIEELLKQ